MEPDLPGGVVEAREEVSVEEERVPAGWEELVLEPDPVENVSALIVAPGYPIKPERPATI